MNEFRAPGRLVSEGGETLPPVVSVMIDVVVVIAVPQPMPDTV